MDRHELREFANNMDINSNEDVAKLQLGLNKLMGPEKYNAYEEGDTLSVDGMYGPNTKTRLRHFLKVDNIETSNAVFDALESKRRDFDEQSRFNKYHQKSPEAQREPQESPGQPLPTPGESQEFRGSGFYRDSEGDALYPDEGMRRAEEGIKRRKEGIPPYLLRKPRGLE